MGKRGIAETEAEGSDVQETPRRKLRRLTLRSSSSGHNQHQSISQSVNGDIELHRGLRTTSAPSRFLDEGLFRSNPQRSLESYKKFLDNITSTIDDACRSYGGYESASYREWNASWKQRECPLDIPDSERVIELSDNDGDDGFKARAGSTAESSTARDSRSPTLAKILNAKDEDQPSQRV